MAFNEQDFEQKLNALRGDTIAVGVSGGPDSMALLWLLSRYAQKHDVTIHAYTVDHGLRAESADEAKKVAGWVSDWPGVTHKILRWEGEKPDTRILEEARAARYRLIADDMMKSKVEQLFIAHHQDDQAETFLIRLAKGSGLDGLCAMHEQQKLDSGITLVRPLLDISKDELIALCHANDIPYVEDPTNKNDEYLRPRLRAARAVLEEEGLTSKRLAVTAARLSRAQEALELYAEDLYQRAIREEKEDGMLFNLRPLRGAPEEMVLRVMLKAMKKLHPDRKYGPRMEQVEDLMARIFKDPAVFKSATLGGCLFSCDIKEETLWIGREA